MPSAKRSHGWANWRLRQLGATFASYILSWRLDGLQVGVGVGFGFSPRAGLYGVGRLGGPRLCGDDELYHGVGHRVFALFDESQQGFVDGRIDGGRFVLVEQFFVTDVTALRVIETTLGFPLLETVVVGNR